MGATPWGFESPLRHHKADDMTSLSTPSFEVFSGCLLGLALGDALGAPFEGMPPGNYSIDCMDGILSYTDDTEMMINLLRAIIDFEDVETSLVAKYFAEGLNPERGYGPGTLRVLALVRQGIPVDRAVRSVFPEGSYGNGAAMRVAPLGLLYFGDEERLEEAVIRASKATHVHPVAIDGARVVALAVSYVMRGYELSELPEYLVSKVDTDIFADKLEKVNFALKHSVTKEWVIQNLGTGVAASESVPTAIYAFLGFGRDFERMINFCIGLGGDTDTISAMAGALSGTMLSEKGLPENCLKRLEHYQQIKEIGKRLYERLFNF